MQSLGSSLAQGVGEELRAAQSLVDLLRQEQSCLIGADVEALGKLTEEKTKIVVRMTELAQRRYQELAGAGFEASDAGMEQWASSAQPTAVQSWKDLLDLARQAKELNRVNGMLIGQHMARNQAALNILQGAPQGGNMYGPNGQSANQTSSRKLVVG